MKTMLALAMLACAACGGHSDDAQPSCIYWGFQTTEIDGGTAPANVLLKDCPTPPAGCVPLDDAGHVECPET